MSVQQMKPHILSAASLAVAFAAVVIAGGAADPMLPPPVGLNADNPITVDQTPDDAKRTAAGFGDPSARVVSFQGRLTDADGVPVPDGASDLTFSLYLDQDTTTSLWTETHNSVAIKDGRFSVLLGSLAPLDNPDGDDETEDAVSFAEPLYLGIKVGTDLEMRPRKQIVPAVYAHEAGNAQTLGGESSDQLIPAGAMMPYGGSLAPDGWLICEGAEISREEYAELFAAIGIAFGSLGPETFTLPDFRLRYPLGDGAGISVGESYGSEAHSHPVTASIALAGVHGHFVSADTFGMTVTGGGGGAGSGSLDHEHFYAAITSGDGTHAHTATASSEASSEVEDRYPPSVIVKYIIRH